MAGTSLICTQSLFYIQLLPDSAAYAPKSLSRKLSSLRGH